MHLATQGAGCQSGGEGRRHFGRCQVRQEGKPLRFCGIGQGQCTGGVQQCNQLVQAAQVAEGLGKRSEQGEIILPAAPAVQGHGTLPRAGAVERLAACETIILGGTVDRAAVMCEVPAWIPRRFVEGEFTARVKGQGHAAERGAGRAIWREFRKHAGGQPKASSKAPRKSAESSVSGASDRPKLTVSPPKRPTEAIGTPA